MARKKRLVRRARRCALALKAGALSVLITPGIAFSPQAAAAADPMSVFLSGHPEERAQAVDCLADAIFYEAGFEPHDGKLAVAQVVLNRVHDASYPDTVCGVVYEGSERKTGCQFSFTCDGSRERRPPSVWQRWDAEFVAAEALKGKKARAVDDATNYHAEYVKPYWAPTLDKVVQIGTHIFYENPYRSRDGKASYHGGEIAERALVAGA